VCYELALGYSTSTSSGAVQMTGGGLSLTWEYPGYNGTGVFTQDAGTNDIQLDLNLGNNPGSSGTYNLIGGLLTVGGWERVGAAGTGTFTQSGGTQEVTNSGLVIPNSEGASGTYILSGGLLLDPHYEGVGPFGTGSFTQSGGTHVVGLLDIGGQQPTLYGNGTYLLSGGSLAVTGTALIGDSSIGTFLQSGGTASFLGVVEIANVAGSQGTYDLNGGQFAAQSITVGSGSATFNLNGGTLQALQSNSNFFAGATNLTVNVQNGGATVDTQGYSVVVGTNLLQSGSGGLTKIGSGMLSLSGSNSYTGGTTINQGTLQLGGPSALGSGGLIVGSNGTLDLNSFGLTLPWLNGSAGAVITDNSTPANQPTSTILAVNIVSGGSTYAGSITKGINGQDIAVVKGGLGMLTLAGTSNYTGGTTINQGVLNVTGALVGGGNVQIYAGSSLTGSGLVQGSITGQAGSSIMATGNLVLGDSTSFTGFNHAGTLTVGNNSVTLNSEGFANLGVLTTLAGGTIVAPNGISLGVGCNLSGSGTVQGKVAAGYGSTINATGNLTLGDSTSPVGYVSDGELYTNSNTVTLNSSNAANNQNAVVLGSLTQIDGGNLVAPNGMLLSSGFNLVTTDNGGTVSGGTASRFLNLGNVQGPSSASSNWLTFNMLFKGGTGQTSGRIAFLGGFATGDSPGVNNQYGTTELGGIGTEFDIGGTSPGDNDDDYGQLNILTNPQDVSNYGDLTLLPGTRFNIVDWDGFVPTPGETFTVLTWDGSLSGTASMNIDPAFAAEGIQFVPEWNSNSLVLEATPEPSTLILAAAAGIGLAGYAWRRRHMQAAKHRRRAEDVHGPQILSLPSQRPRCAETMRRAA
jgi:autotransporter-associated beta strand protein